MLPLVVKRKASGFDVLDGIGIVAESDIKQKISSIYSPPNAPSTIAKKGSSKPLIDSGFMLASVSHGVAKEGSEFA